MAERRSDLLCWIDLETTGLDPIRCGILEVAMMLTTRDLEIVAPIRSTVIYMPEPSLYHWDDAASEMHDASALGIISSQTTGNLDRFEAEIMLVEWLAEHAEPGTLTPTGNSVNFDVGFLRLHMPDLYRLLHYQQLNVSSLAKWCDWQFGVGLYKKQKAHRAAADLWESYAELAWIRGHLDWRIGPL